MSTNVKTGMTYAGTGVDYNAMDPQKQKSLLAGMATECFLKRFGLEAVPWTRGESIFLVKNQQGQYLGLVVEGIGTKPRVADKLRPIAEAMGVLTGRSYYDNLAQCNVAMAVNDAITLGARPVLYGQYLAIGESSWLNDKDRADDLISGTKGACIQSRCTWGGGETPTLKGIIVPGTVDLAGAALAIVPSEEELINPANIQAGDAIVIIESSGGHANGYTLFRSIAERKDSIWQRLLHCLVPDEFPLRALPKGYLTKLSDGRTYGVALLEPTHIYVPLVEDCQNNGVKIHYAINVTGHGWRKFMRALQKFAYIIERIPNPGPLFEFVQKHGPVSDYEAYGNLNMGAGFALYVSEADVMKVIEIATRLGLVAFRAGHIEASDEKKVVIKPLGLVYTADTLAVR